MVAQSIVRPYWFSESIDFEALSESEKQAIEQIVVPVYEALVVGAGSPLERSAGVTVAFLLCEELVAQFELGSTMPLGRSAGTDSTKREQLIDRYLRLTKCKQKAENFILRIKQASKAFAGSAWGRRTLNRFTGEDFGKTQFC